MMQNVLLFSDGTVGYQITSWMIKHHNNDLGLVVTTSENEISEMARENHIETTVFQSDEQIINLVDNLDLKPEIGYLLWWPKLIKTALLSIPHRGFINTHPSLLPHNRGKHYNFWAIVEEVPFGVSLHYVDEGVDTGDIVAQREISYGWEDTGETLFFRAQKEMVSLFQDTYQHLRMMDIEPTTQDNSKGSMHRASELDTASRIDLNQNYTARKLLNLLRARTFTGHPSCHFFDNGKKYKVSINIQELENDTEE